MPGRASEGPDDRLLDTTLEVGAIGAGLQSLQAILGRLLDPASTTGEVARLIANEPGLTARVLRVANSAFYGMSGSVATLDRAILLLGTDAVRGVAAAACLDRVAIRAVAGSPVDLRTLVRHSLAVAVGAEMLARLHHRELAPVAFVAGLLHDLGILVQVQLDRDGLARMVAALPREPGLSAPERERRHDLVGHERCGEALLRSWRLPERLALAAGHHHAPFDAPEQARPLATLVALANRLAVEASLCHVLESHTDPVPDDWIEGQPWSRQELETVRGALPARVQELLDLLV